MHGSCYMLKTGIIPPRGMANDRVGLFASVDGPMNIKRDYAQAPTKLMQKAPPKTRRQAMTLFFPRRTRQLSSLRKSSDISSTREAKMRRPAEMAFMVPTTSNPTSEPGLYSVCVARPMACPIGVLHAC